MKNIFIILILLSSIKFFSQQKDTIHLSKIKFCELTLDYLKQKDVEMIQVNLEEMDL